MIDLREALVEGMQYDDWANRQWLDAIDRFKNPSHVRDILKHVIRAKHIWLSRIEGTETVPECDFDADSIAQTSANWIDLLRREDIHRDVEYKTLNGSPFIDPIHRIARHVINHGTYH